MGNKIMENTEDSLALLRNKVKDEVVISDFRRKLIGGISEEDVEDYVNAVRMQAEYKEGKLNEKIEDLISSRDNLKIEYNTYVKNAEEEKKRLQKELEEVKQNLQQYMEQCKTTDARISDSEDKYKAELERLKLELKKASDEKAEIENKLNNIYKENENSKANILNFDNEKKLYELQVIELKKELSTVQSRLDERSKAFRELEEQLKGSRQTVLEHERERDAMEEKLKNEQNSVSKIMEENNKLHSKSENVQEELKTMYNELKTVKEQVKMNYVLQRQLEQERSKTEKVEKEMTDFFKRIIELKKDN